MRAAEQEGQELRQAEPYEQEDRIKGYLAHPDHPALRYPVRPVPDQTRQTRLIAVFLRTKDGRIFKTILLSEKNPLHGHVIVPETAGEERACFQSARRGRDRT